MARQLMDQGEAIGALFVIDSGSPCGCARPAPRDEVQSLLYTVRYLEQLFGVELTIEARDLSSGNRNQVQALLKNELERVGVLPTGTDFTHAAGFLQVVQANLQINYVPAKASVPHIVYLRAAEGDLYADNDQPGDRGWSALSSEPAELELIAGDHQSRAACVRALQCRPRV